MQQMSQVRQRLDWGIALPYLARVATEPLIAGLPVTVFQHAFGDQSGQSNGARDQHRMRKDAFAHIGPLLSHPLKASRH